MGPSCQPIKLVGGLRNGSAINGELAIPDRACKLGAGRESADQLLNATGRTGVHHTGSTTPIECVCVNEGDLLWCLPECKKTVSSPLISVVVFPTLCRTGSACLVLKRLLRLLQPGQHYELLPERPHPGRALRGCLRKIRNIR